MTLPLEGLRIVAAEHWAAGPYATGYLADLGADVIKIENRAQGGDACRAGGPYFLGEGDSHVFQAFNRNKRSLTLDLKHPDGRQVLHRLAATADAFMHNLRGDQAAKLGLTYTDLAPSNPEIVCVHISAYGSAPKPARRCASLCAGFASGPATPTSHGPTAPGRLRSRSRLFHASEGERSDWAGVRLPHAGGGRVLFPHRRTRGAAGTLRTVDDRLHDGRDHVDGDPGRHPRRPEIGQGARYRRDPLRCRHVPVDPSRRVVPERRVRDPACAPVEPPLHGSLPALPDTGWLDHGDGPEPAFPGALLRSRRSWLSEGGPAFRRHRGPPREPGCLDRRTRCCISAAGTRRTGLPFWGVVSPARRFTTSPRRWTARSSEGGAVFGRFPTRLGPASS